MGDRARFLRLKLHLISLTFYRINTSGYPALSSMSTPMQAAVTHPALANSNFPSTEFSCLLKLILSLASEDNIRPRKLKLLDDLRILINTFLRDHAGEQEDPNRRIHTGAPHGYILPIDWDSLFMAINQMADLVKADKPILIQDQLVLSLRNMLREWEKIDKKTQEFIKDSEGIRRTSSMLSVH